MLSYNKTVDSLQAMFPFIDRTVIENVLEANSGHIENTVECLLEIDYPVEDQGPEIVQEPEKNPPVNLQQQTLADEQLAIILQEALYHSEAPNFGKKRMFNEYKFLISCLSLQQI